jgi:hypothetical protein
MRYNKLFLTFGLVMLLSCLWGQDSTVFGDRIRGRPWVTPEQDSLLKYLIQNRSGLKFAVEIFDWKRLLLTLVGFLFFVSLTWKLWAEDWIKNHIKNKAQEAVENLANLKGANILVLSSAKGSDAFLRDFFKAKKFSNLRFEHIGDDFASITDFDYDVVFVNNDDGKINQDIARQHCRVDNVLFYFGKERWDINKDSPELGRSLNMANSRAQIYGNLMSSLEFLELVKPKIKNV